MRTGADIMAEAAGGKKGTVQALVRVDRGVEASVLLLFARGDLTGTTHGMTLKALEDNARDLSGDAYMASDLVRQALEGTTVHRNAPTGEEVTVHAGRGGLYLQADIRLSVQGEGLDRFDLWKKATDALKGQWRVKP